MFCHPKDFSQTPGQETSPSKNFHRGEISWLVCERPAGERVYPPIFEPIKTWKRFAKRETDARHDEI